MAQQLIANNETGASVRGKLNDNFSEVYDGIDKTKPLRARAPMKVVSIGNSINNPNKRNVSGLLDRYQSNSDIMQAQYLAGSPFMFPTIVPTTRTDKHGAYGYSSQTSATILADLDVQFFQPLRGAGEVPDFVILHSLFENDLMAGANAATIAARRDAVIRRVRAEWPGVPIGMFTPAPKHPAFDGFEYDQTAYDTVTAEILALHNGFDFFAIHAGLPESAGGYADATDTRRPAVRTLAGASINLTTLTVPGDIGGPLPMGIRITGSGVSNNTDVREPISVNADGSGTYLVSVSQNAPATTMTAHIYGDGIHPNTLGAMVRARNFKTQCLDLMADVWVWPKGQKSTNPIFNGSAAATGTNVSGTKATDVTIPGHSQANNVLTALQPGMRIVTASLITRAAAYCVYDSSSLGFDTAVQAMTEGPKEIYVFQKVKIIAGAENIRLLELKARLLDASGNNFQYGTIHQGLAADGKYENNDVLTFRLGPFQPASGFLTEVRLYFGAWAKQIQLGTGTFTLEFLEQGISIISLGKNLPLNAATHTIQKVNAGRLHEFDRAAGSTATLPAATGSGDEFSFSVKTALTSNSNIIKAASSTDSFIGFLSMIDSDDSSASNIIIGGTDDTLTLNGTTGGGLVGDMVTFVDTAPGVYSVFGTVRVPAGSNPADPFTATV